MKILLIRDEEFERLQHYANPDYGSGGWQGLCRKLLSRVVEDATTVDALKERLEKEEKGLFG